MIKPLKPFIPLLPTTSKGFLRVNEEGLLEIDEDGVLAVNYQNTDKFFHFVLNNEDSEIEYQFDCIHPTALELIKDDIQLSSHNKLKEKAPITMAELPIWKEPDLYKEKFLLAVDIKTNKLSKIPIDVILGYQKEKSCFPEEKRINNIFFSTQEKLTINKNGKIVKTPLHNVTTHTIDRLLNLINSLNEKLMNYDENFDIFL